VQLHRSLPGNGATPAIQIPGPLRVLVAIGSPESDNDRGELLDMEAELRHILDALEAARSQGRAYVRVLHRGTVAAVRDALAAQRFHVLHISCHAGPGVLMLEDEEGKADEVDAERFVREVLPVGRGSPSWCSPAVPRPWPREPDPVPAQRARRRCPGWLGGYWSTACPRSWP
jgi:hypothetical protein